MAKDKDWQQNLPKEEGQFVIVVQDHENLGVSFTAGQVLEIEPIKGPSIMTRQLTVKVGDVRKSFVLARYCSSIYPNKEWAERVAKRRFN